jgi:hypothetical protein
MSEADPLAGYPLESKPEGRTEKFLGTNLARSVFVRVIDDALAHSRRNTVTNNDENEETGH